MRQSLLFIAGILGWIASALPATGIETNPVLKDINSNLSQTGPIVVTRVGFADNVVRRFTIDQVSSGGHTGGASFTIAISNGENGTNVGPGAGNSDIPNDNGIGAAIDIVNGGDGTQGHRLTNGNAFRFSVWMQQDPANPVDVELSVEPVLKFELWSEAESINGDFASGRGPSAAFGDRLWDTDINARAPYFDPYNVSRSSSIDISGNETVVSGDEPVASLPIATGVEWVRVETTIVIDDDPDDSGFGWDVAGQGYKVDMIEEVRATFFMGDFTGDSVPLNDGGSIFVDNALLEIFPDEATMLATENPNPLPLPVLVGDYNNNDVVDAADYTVWRDSLTSSAAALANRSPNVTGVVKQTDYDMWKVNFGEVLGGGSGGGSSAAILAYAPAQAVPEPGTLLLCLIASVGAACMKRHR